MTPKIFSIKGHTWARVDAKDEAHSITLLVYEHSIGPHSDRYFIEYRGPDSEVVRMRSETREGLFRAAADAIFLGKIEAPEGFDLDDAIDDCELLLFGRVLR